MCPILNSFGETRLLDQDAAPSSCSSFIDVAAARSGVTYEPPPDPRYFMPKKGNATKLDPPLA